MGLVIIVFLVLLFLGMPVAFTIGISGTLFFLQRELSKLPTKGRPLSQKHPLEEMYKARLPLYRSFADAEIDNNGKPEATADRILEVFE